MNELSIWLAAIRKEAKLGLPALAEKTKIMTRHLEAIEAGDFKALPTSVHARAFALAFARACGADDDEAMERVSQTLAPVNPQAKAAVEAPSPVRPERMSQGAPAAPASTPAPQAPAQPAEPAAPGPLPWKLWSVIAIAALLFMLALHGVVSCVRGDKAAGAGAIPQLAAPVAATTGADAAPQGVSPGASASELALRSRRPCWVLLVIDGKRLPTVFLEPDKRERWMVNSKAVMLAGNIGAVRVWWRGDNLGYFGELGERMNGIVFENGKPWRREAAEELPLPPGVPSKAGN